MNPLPVGFHAFTPQITDAARAAELYALVEISEWGGSDWQETDVVEEWTALDLDKSVVLIANECGDLVASMTLLGRAGVAWEAYGYVHPAYQQREIGTWIVGWAEDMAAQRIDETRDGYEIVMHNFIGLNNQTALHLLHDLGYETTRIFRRMRIDLTERPDIVIWPAGLELHPFTEGRDEQLYFQTIATTFADHWSAAPRTLERWQAFMKTKGYDVDLWLQLYEGDKIIGIAAGKISGDRGWIPNVGVLREYRRRGLARRLLQELFIRYWDRGITRIELAVDDGNRNSAIDLYHGVGMRLTHSYEGNRKILRPGRDWHLDEHKMD